MFYVATCGVTCKVFSTLEDLMNEITYFNLKEQMATITEEKDCLSIDNWRIWKKHGSICIQDSEFEVTVIHPPYSLNEPVTFERTIFKTADEVVA